MTDLADTFGEDFAESVQQEIQSRRQERESLSDETRRAIADLAINEGKMEGGDPMFTYTTDEGITHTVMLMQLPDPQEGSVWNYANELDSGAVTLPMDYLGDWMSCLFNDKEEARKMEVGEWYLVAGNLDTWTDQDGNENDQLSPVRGVITLEEAKEMADSGMEEEGFDGEDDEDEGFTSEPEPKEDDEDDSDGGSLFGSDDDDEEEDEGPAIDATVSEVEAVVEELAEQEPEVWEVHEDHDELDTLVLAVCDRLKLNPDDTEVANEVKEIVLDRVEEEREDDDEDEEDSIF